MKGLHSKQFSHCQKPAMEHQSFALNREASASINFVRATEAALKDGAMGSSMSIGGGSSISRGKASVTVRMRGLV